jgi:hypothetical protein
MFNQRIYLQLVVACKQIYPSFPELGVVAAYFWAQMCGLDKVT